MKVKDIIKKQTTIIAIAVVLVTLATIGVSYAVFFDVKTNDKNQVITAGTLKLKLSSFETINLESPMSTEQGLETKGASYTIENTDSNLPAKYSIYIYANSGNTVGPELIKVALTKTSVATDEKGSTLASLKTDDPMLKTEKDGDKTYYLIDTGTLAANTNTESKTIKLWLDESSITEELDNKVVDLQLYVVSEVDESQTPNQSP